MVCIKAVISNIILFRIVLASLHTENAKFYTTNAAFVQQNELTYTRVGKTYLGGSHTYSVLQCLFVCMKESQCGSAYLDNGACVFGVTDDVNAFEGGEDITPDPNQEIKVKGKTVMFTRHCNETKGNKAVTFYV